MPANHRHALLLTVVLTSVALLFAGCAAATVAAPPSAPNTAERSTSEATTPAKATESTPSQAALMICAEETRNNIAKILSLAHPSQPEARWADGLYTCTYHVPTGTLRLSVKQSTDPAAARSYFTAQQNSVGKAQTIEGLANLGLPAYQTPDGNVSFVKDNMTLHVDASQLVADSPPTRTHLAYQIATVILGCWSE
jgi:hypothetical protein